MPRFESQEGMHLDCRVWQGRRKRTQAEGREALLVSCFPVGASAERKGPKEEAHLGKRGKNPTFSKEGRHFQRGEISCKKVLVKIFTIMQLSARFEQNCAFGAGLSCSKLNLSLSNES